NAGASAWVVSVETPKRPSAAARRVAGAKTTASVDAALNADAKARPCTMRSRYIAGPIACTNRKAAEAAPMVAMPASRKSRQPTGSERQRELRRRRKRRRERLKQRRREQARERRRQRAKSAS